jgi:hypothetical protein
VLPGCSVAAGIRAYTLFSEGNPFEELFASLRFEDVGKGRQGAVLTKVDRPENIPIVRTTTRYRNPAQRFRLIHEQLAQKIQDTASLALDFNNALVESYTDAYTTMGAHSDQALDLAEGSFIALFSCYKQPEMAKSPRKLIVESKASEGERAEIPMAHNGVLVFSVDTNRRLRHKIVLATSSRSLENQWLGFTFRTSKTLVRFSDGRMCFPDDEGLTLANDDQRREFYHLRRRENDELDFRYPRVTYTISESDLMPPQ